ncbi:hypothetical protein BS47DRAFT_1396012 [Hydnum rufescens UP504]|uniref:Uncharacterized protein n=1 Tax=Hydnum rufescens UP504 TaxID=1448309 RepID=A0A9P6AR57_9AGAM|nr:hypothetical protein BS47DRAFT_1396012 [Hydnum rufescens UP504]
MHRHLDNKFFDPPVPPALVLLSPLLLLKIPPRSLLHSSSHCSSSHLFILPFIHPPVIHPPSFILPSFILPLFILPCSSSIVHPPRHHPPIVHPPIVHPPVIHLAPSIQDNSTSPKTLPSLGP